jgi:hypothetical protein
MHTIYRRLKSACRSSAARRLFALAAAGALASCATDGVSSSTAVTLVASPTLLQITEQNPTQKLFLSTSPSGRLDWQLTAKPTWVTVAPTSGTIRGEPVEVTVTADFSKAEPGTYMGRIELIGSGGAAAVEVQGVVSANPIPAFSVTSSTIADGADSAMVTVTNTGRGVLSWQAGMANSWATVSPASGFLNTGASTVLKVKVDRTTLPAGTATTGITLRSNARSGDVTLPVSVVVAPNPVGAVSRSSLKYTSGVTQQSLYLFNRGKGPLNWTAAPSISWISASPASGAVAPGDSVLITTTVNRAAAGAEATGSLVLTTDARVNHQLTIAVTVTASTPAAGFRNLAHRVVDAEYSRSGDFLVTVSANPAQLHVLDPDLGTTRSVALPKTPTSVSIRPDGAYAAVGHDGLVSIVNLGTRAVERTYPVTTHAIDVVLGGNGWVYVFPIADQWVSIHSINLATGVESTNSGTIRAGTLVKIHPSGDYIYGANNGLSPSDIEKYDIRGGAARVLYDSPYHGDYPFSGNLWISEDGGRIIARSGNVFRSSTVRAEDMTYNGRLTGINYVQSAADSRVAGRIVVLGGAALTDLKVFESQFLAYRGTVPLPRFTVPGSTTEFASEGQFVFANSEGTRVYVLVRAPASSGLQQDWGMATLLMSSVP